MPIRSVLHVAQILEWADTYHKHAGKWPTTQSGRIVGAVDVTWCAIDKALSNGNRGFPGGWSLARLLSEYRGKRLQAKRPDLTIEQILKWADAYFKREGKWPTGDAGPIVGATKETWLSVNQALRYGTRGLPGGSSLVKLLVKSRGIRNRGALPSLSLKQILKWADAHFRHTGEWPAITSQRIPGADHENWSAINAALRTGYRGLPGGASLAQLLAEHRGKRNQSTLPPFNARHILKWADAYHQQTGAWPTPRSGAISGADQETWTAVDAALTAGGRGLPGGSSLARFLAKHRGKRNPGALPTFTVEQILEWADAYHQHTGEWPTPRSGQIPGADQETWSAVQAALNGGMRGLPGGSSLARLLAEHRGRRNQGALPPLRIKQILAWADAHYQRTGNWPSLNSGPVAEDPDETWNAIDLSLRHGGRGLPGTSSLADLLADHGKKRNRGSLPKLTFKQILAWVDAHRERTGEWPNKRSGPIVDAEETWGAVNSALRAGIRGLPGRSSLADLLSRHRAVRNLGNLPQLSTEMILAWADAYHKRMGVWPTARSGSVVGARSEKWIRIDQALLLGYRGLPGGASLAKLLAEHRGKRNMGTLPPFTEAQILAWADAHQARSGRWPSSDSGPIEETGETWKAVQQALSLGNRGMPGGSSLFKLLQKQRGAIHARTRPQLELKTILKWADAHHARTEKWPNQRSGPIPDADGDTWAAVDIALNHCKRGVLVKTSLAQLLHQHRGVRPGGQ